MTEELLIEKVGAVLNVTFNRPAQRNAMTWNMYQGLHDACERADADDDIRIMVLRGAGGESFVAGTDISQFVEFDGERGLEYESQVGSVLARLARVNVPVVAAIEGYCVGGGLSIAAMADIRICNASATFGVPIARTLGNCLSLNTLAVLTQLLGRSRTAEILLTARLMPADEALACGFVSLVTANMDDELDKLTDRLSNHAPLTMWAVKEGLRRLHPGPDHDDDDIVRAVYGSNDFASGVQAFLAKQKPAWSGH
ncbi:enoyl-CoA hydratase [Arthrobacter sp. MPF02]|uniref:enoyl-CoA hydratase n=1 Tax=Arthrobacter sp. MPF02 TaxID=3388492 RepID=UPI003984E729